MQVLKKETRVRAGLWLMDGRFPAKTARMGADVSIISLERRGHCVCPELKYLHFLAIMDFLLCLRDWGSRPKSFLHKAAEARRRGLILSLYILCAQLLRVPRGMDVPRAAAAAANSDDVVDSRSCGKKATRTW